MIFKVAQQVESYRSYFLLKNALVSFQKSKLKENNKDESNQRGEDCFREKRGSLWRINESQSLIANKEFNKKRGVLK